MARILNCHYHHNVLSNCKTEKPLGRLLAIDRLRLWNEVCIHILDIPFYSLDLHAISHWTLLLQLDQEHKETSSKRTCEEGLASFLLTIPYRLHLTSDWIFLRQKSHRMPKQLHLQQSYFLTPVNSRFGRYALCHVCNLDTRCHM